MNPILFAIGFSAPLWMLVGSSIYCGWRRRQIKKRDWVGALMYDPVPQIQTMLFVGIGIMWITFFVDSSLKG